MKKNYISFMPLLFLLMLLMLNLVCIGHSAQAMTNEQFGEKVGLYVEGKITPEKFYALCERAIIDVDADTTNSNKENIIGKILILDTLGIIYYMNGDFSAVHMVADRLEKLSGSGSEFYAELHHGSAFMGEGKLPEAQKKFELALQKTNSKGGAILLPLEKIEILEALKNSIDATEIWQKVGENRLAAENKFKGKKIAVEGIISDIRIDNYGVPVVIFSINGKPFNKITCRFTRGWRFTLEKLIKGQRVNIVGECMSIEEYNIILNKCDIFLKSSFR